MLLYLSTESGRHIRHTSPCRSCSFKADYFAKTRLLVSQLIKPIQKPWCPFFFKTKAMSSLWNPITFTEICQKIVQIKCCYFGWWQHFFCARVQMKTFSSRQHFTEAFWLKSHNIIHTSSFTHRNRNIYEQQAKPAKIHFKPQDL